MEKMYVLMNVVKSIPTELGLDASFGKDGTIGCLLVFDSIDSLREMSPDGKFAVMQYEKQLP